MELTQPLSQSRFVLLPPSSLVVPTRFRCVQVNSRQHDDLLAEIQRFRGKIYCDDGAVPLDQLTADGRHVAAADYQSWHILSVDSHEHVCACVRYLDESSATQFDDLLVRNAAIVCAPGAPLLRLAVERQMAEARELHLGFGEVGGWAVSPDRRGSLEALRIILATYGLLELLGGCTGVATATFRHHSSTILRRIGLTSLCLDGVPLPPYFDPHYGCEMEVLRFDSRSPNPRYSEVVAEFTASLINAQVICPDADSTKTHVPIPIEVPEHIPPLGVITSPSNMDGSGRTAVSLASNS